MHYEIGEVLGHPLLAGRGLEPLDKAFNGQYLHEKSRGRRQSVKTYLMDSRIVASFGNIYANEALFEAGAHPARPAGSPGHAMTGWPKLSNRC